MFAAAEIKANDFTLSGAAKAASMVVNAPMDKPQTLNRCQPILSVNASKSAAKSAVVEPAVGVSDPP